jgi:hypothetical protein
MIDKNKLCELIKKSKSGDLLYLNVNPVDKNSLKSVLNEIEKFIGKNEVDVVLLRK